MDHALEKEESGPPAHGHDSRAERRCDVRGRERESGRRRGGGGGGEEERHCSKDSSEAGGPTRGTVEDEGEGRHSSEVRDLREAQRKTKAKEGTLAR